MGRYFDDLELEMAFLSPAVMVTREEIRDFAAGFDPNPFHHDLQAAIQAGYRDVIASGFHSLALSFRLFFDLQLWDEAGLASPGLQELRWLRPLYPGDQIQILAKVIDRRLSRSDPNVGIVSMRHETFNQDGDLILSVVALHRLRCHTGKGADDSGRESQHGTD
jgi:acyl dehydratase